MVGVGVSKLSMEPRELLRSVEEYGLDSCPHCKEKSLETREEIKGRKWHCQYFVTLLSATFNFQIF